MHYRDGIIKSYSSNEIEPQPLFKNIISALMLGKLKSNTKTMVYIYITYCFIITARRSSVFKLPKIRFNVNTENVKK